MKSHFDPIISAWLAYEISQSREFPTWGFQCVHSMSQPKHPAPSSSIHRLVSSSLSILAYLPCSPSHSVVEKSSKEDSTTVWLGFLDFLYEEQYVPQVDASPVVTSWGFLSIFCHLLLAASVAHRTSVAKSTRFWDDVGWGKCQNMIEYAHIITYNHI